MQNRGRQFFGTGLASGMPCSSGVGRRFHTARESLVFNADCRLAAPEAVAEAASIMPRIRVAATAALVLVVLWHW